MVDARPRAPSSGFVTGYYRAALCCRHHDWPGEILEEQVVAVYPPGNCINSADCTVVGVLVRQTCRRSHHVTGSERQP